MNLEQLAEWLFGRTSGGIRWGLERTRELLAEAGDPHLRFRSIHVGGTNGKGSVASLCAASLRARGAGPVGLYTSPHLVSFTERIQVDGRPVSERAVLDAAERLRLPIERSGATFFEATTAIAMLCLADAGVEAAVVEVGLGGRLDATNVLAPEVAVITNIALEHTEFLGDTVEAIAAEKAGILKPGVPAITAAADAAAAVIARRAAEVGAPLVHLDDVCELLGVGTGAGGTEVRFRSRTWGERTVRIPLAGAFQARNALLAAEALALLPEALRPSWEEVRAGFAAARWPGRMQRAERRGTTLLLDVAHNPAGVAALCDTLPSLDLPRPLVVVAGILADKAWDAMLPRLIGLADAAILTVPPSAPPTRRWDPEAAAEALLPSTRAPIRVIPSLDAALERAVTLAPYGTVLVTGSIHTVGDAMLHFGIDPFADPAEEEAG